MAQLTAPGVATSRSPSPASAGERGGLRRSAGLRAWAFMLPLLAVNALVVLVPSLLSVYYSFTDWSGLGDASFVGLANYRRLLADEEFHGAFVHNLFWLAFFMTVPMGMGLLGAFLLSRVRRFQLLFRVAYFIPYISASVVNASIWQSLLSPDAGIGKLLEVNFLGSQSLSLPSVAFVHSWAWWGFLVMVFLAAMRGVDPSLYEAARLDGAGGWRQFHAVTLPGIRPTLVFVALMTVIWSFLAFDYVFIMTQGGPAGATEVVGTLLYRRAFSSFEAGYAAAMGVLLALISGLVVATYQVLNRRRGWDA